MTYPYIPRFTKDPQAVLDFNWDWRAWLGPNETISDSTITPDGGMTSDGRTISNGVVSAFLSGGAEGNSYTVACKVVTSAGRTDVRRIKIDVRAR